MIINVNSRVCHLHKEIRELNYFSVKQKNKELNPIYRMI